MNFPLLRRLNGTAMPDYLCDLSGARPTAATVDSLARLALLLRREGSRPRLARGPPPARPPRAARPPAPARGVTARAPAGAARARRADRVHGAVRRAASRSVKVTRRAGTA